MLFTFNALKITSLKITQVKRSFVKVETGSHELVILSYATACLHPSVLLNNEKNCRQISKDKIAVCEKIAGLRSGNSSDLDSACLKALVPVEIFQFSDMHYESRFLDTFRGHNIRPTELYYSLEERLLLTSVIEVKPKTWRIFTFTDDNWYHHRPTAYGIYH